MDLMAEKPQKFHKISCISIFAICSMLLILLFPTFFNIFTCNFEISSSTKFVSYFIDRISEFRIWRHFPVNYARMAPNPPFKNPINKIAAKFSPEANFKISRKNIKKCRKCSNISDWDRVKKCKRRYSWFCKIVGHRIHIFRDI